MCTNSPKQEEEEEREEEEIANDGIHVDDQETQKVHRIFSCTDFFIYALLCALESSFRVVLDLFPILRGIPFLNGVHV